MTPSEQYLTASGRILDAVRAQQPSLHQAANWFAQTILAGRMVHVFGSGHSRIMVEEMWPRYGSFPGFNPIVELSLTFHNLVVGANGQRQAMFLENVPRPRRAHPAQLRPVAAGHARSSSPPAAATSCPIEMAEEFQQRGVQRRRDHQPAHSEAQRQPRMRDGKKLQDFADLVLDTGAPVGDAMVTIDGLDTPVAPGSTVGGCLLVNCHQGRSRRAPHRRRPAAEGAHAPA